MFILKKIDFLEFDYHLETYQNLINVESEKE
jgi:hypothetical protein